MKTDATRSAYATPRPGRIPSARAIHQSNGRSLVTRSVSSRSATAAVANATALSVTATITCSAAEVLAPKAPASELSAATTAG